MAQRLDAALELLDRQLLDRDGTPAGKVDDLELTDSGEGLKQPYVTAILTGPGALAAASTPGSGAGSHGSVTGPSGCQSTRLRRSPPTSGGGWQPTSCAPAPARQGCRSS
jgi:hypothetical protein